MSFGGTAGGKLGRGFSISLFFGNVWYLDGLVDGGRDVDYRHVRVGFAIPKGCRHTCVGRGRKLVVLLFGSSDP